MLRIPFARIIIAYQTFSLPLFLLYIYISKTSQVGQLITPILLKLSAVAAF